MDTPDKNFTYTENPIDRDAFQHKHGIIGRSMEIREVVDILMQVAPTDITVLITGESGTGKEVIARALHSASARSQKKMVSVNCGAIPEGILESELFGHEKGSFTGAVESRKGYFEIANGGTIFLDEIGEMPISTQVKLLRVLENGEFFRVGSSEPMYVDVRIIAATNKELEEEAASRRFRQDLYYRLRSVNIHLPSLRQRRADIPLLIDYFLKSKNSADHQRAVMFTDDARNAMMQYSWPGNIRELRNVIESISVLERGAVIDAHTLKKYLQGEIVQQYDRFLPIHLGKSSEQAEREIILRALLEIRADIVEIKKNLFRQPETPLALPPRQEADGLTVTIDDYSLEDMEKLMIQHALDRFDGNRRLAARALKTSERTLYRKIKEYKLS